MKYKKIYLDMDGVLADFDLHFEQLYKVQPRSYEEEHGKERFWELVYENPTFFEDLPIFDHAFDLVESCRKVAESIIILSSPSRFNTPLCVLQKRKWVDKHLGCTFPAIFEKDKHKFAGAERLLIDDTPAKITRWISAGGEGHLFTSYDSLRKYML